MLYFLLIIIAIGVLLLSDEGKWLLGWLLYAGVGAGGLYLTFWIMVILWAFLTTSETGQGLVGIALLIGAYFVLALLYLGAKNLYLKTREILKDKINKKYPKIIPFWHRHKQKFSFINLIIVITVIILSILAVLVVCLQITK